MKFLPNIVRWALGEIREKLDIPGTIRDLKALGLKHGRRFLIFAIAWEIIEDIIFPGLSIWYGMPELVAFFLIFHFELITYPIALWSFRMWDRVRGIEPWDPDRVNTSTYLRTTVKTGLYGLENIFLFQVCLASVDLTNNVLTIGRAVDLGLGFEIALYTMLFAFGFVHERIWNDHNQWIDVETDVVHPRRNLAKAVTYTLVTTMLIASFLNTTGDVPWTRLLIMQGMMFVFYWVWERGWAGVEWGLRPTTRATRKHEDR